MKLALAGAFCLVLLARPAFAHVAFSSVELRMTSGGVEATVVAQAIDLAHELGIDPPERLMNLDFLANERDALGALMNQALTLEADGAPLGADRWGTPAAAPEQQLVRLRTTYRLTTIPGRLTLISRLFAYDTAHQTIVTVYEGDAVRTQQMLDAERAAFDYFTTSRAGFRAAARRFSLAGLQRLLSGYDHLLFIAALLLLGGTLRRVTFIGAAFAASCAIGLTLGAFGAVSPPMLVVAPGLALSVVYASVDNVMIRGGRDVRVWIALAFGWVHGFALAGALNAMDRPVKLWWSAVFFDTGVFAAVALIALGVISLAVFFQTAPRSSSRAWAPTAASLAIAAAGALSFVRHLFAP